MSWEALIMQSKISYFNGTLFRKNLMRFWPLWGGASLAGALVPIAMLMEILRSSRYGDIATPEMTALFYAVLTKGVPIISLLYAILCALAVWHYLYNARSVSMYHSLPILRQGLFVTNFLSGMTMMLIPYLVVGLLTLVTSIVGGFLDLPGLALTALGVIGLSFFYFSTATLVAFITGNPFALAGLYFIFHFLAATLEWLLSVIMAGFYYGVEHAYSGFVEWLSPTIYLTINLNAETSSHYETFTVSTGKTYEEMVIDAAHIVNGHLILLYALAGVGLTALAWLLYKNRRSESAGDVIAVGWMKPVFRYGVSVCMALCGGLGLYYVLFDNFYSDLSGSNFAFLPMAFCMAFAGLLGFYIASMLLAKSLHVFRTTWKGAIAAVVAAAALCGLAAADPIGLERWVPALDEIESISFVQNRFPINVPSCSGNVREPETLQAFLDLHETILAEYRGPRPEQSDEEYSSLRLVYCLKNGRTVIRDYRFTYKIDDIQTDGSAIQKLAEIVTLPEVQLDNIFYDRDNDRQITGGTISGLYDPKTGESKDCTLSENEAKTLEAAILRDINAGHFGQSLYLPVEEHEKAAYTGRIMLYYIYNVQYADGSTSYRNSSNSLSISTYCTETLQALRELGVISENQQLLTQAELNNLFTVPADEAFDGDGDYIDPYSAPYFYDGTTIIPEAQEAF